MCYGGSRAETSHSNVRVITAVSMSDCALHWQESKTVTAADKHFTTGVESPQEQYAIDKYSSSYFSTSYKKYLFSRIMDELERIVCVEMMVRNCYYNCIWQVCLSNRFGMPLYFS